MNVQKLQTLKEIEFQLDKTEHAVQALFPVWMSVDKRLKDLQERMKNLQEKKQAILEGQLTLFEDLNF